MRKRIQQLAMGIFENSQPLLVFSEDIVLVETAEGTDAAGKFVITGVEQEPVRGVIVSSDPRMECLNPQFEGEQVQIRYLFHNYGFQEGNILKGEFTVISPSGEYSLPFVVSVTRQCPDSTVGKIRNLDDFTALAKENFREAGKLFHSEKFCDILSQTEVRERLWYEGMRHGGITDQKLEEFLVAAGKKKKLEFSIGETGAEFFGLLESRRETIELRKNTWGYFEITVTSDADFLVLQKRRLTAEDFIGSSCRYEYDIRREALHAGKNYGCIRFRMAGMELVFTVCVSEALRREKTGISAHRDKEEGKVRLLTLYTDYRLKRIVTGVWANRSVEILDHLMAMEPETAIYSLMKAQALIINRQRQEASWILDDFRRAYKGSKKPVWGYYLYLCTLMEREPSYVDRLTAEIEELFCRYPESSLLFWILLFVREEYYSQPQKRYKAIEAWVLAGHRSPYFYLEAYYLVWQDPYLLGRLDRFAVEVLNWGRKQGGLSGDIAISVMNIVPGKREFDPFLYRILEEYYGSDPSDELLSVICGYLIKGQKFDADCHKWYALGVKRELRITSLYEAFLASSDREDAGNIPKVVQMYFQYNNTLPWQQKARLYAGLITGGARQTKLYQKYRKTIGEFAVRQMEAGHISDDLVVIYEELLRSGGIYEETARALAGVLFTRRLTCGDRGMARAVIRHAQLKDTQVVPLVNGVAYYRSFTDDYCIVLEDNRGNSFIDSASYRDEAMMDPAQYAESCFALMPKCAEYVLYHFYSGSGKEFSRKDEAHLKTLLGLEQLNETSRAELLLQVLRGGKADGRDRLLTKYLQEADLKPYAPSDRRFLLELMTENRMFADVCRLIRTYGYELLPDSARVLILSYAIPENGEEEDAFLLGFALDTFRHGKYNDVMLSYLSSHAQGAVKMLAEIWKASSGFGTDTMALEERILTQMLFTAEYVPYVEQIYENYYAGGGSERVCMAYLSWFSHGYVTRGRVAPEHVFLQIWQRYLEGQKLNEACSLGLLKYLASVAGTGSGWKEKHWKTAERLLDVYTGRRLFFDFYRRFPKELGEKYCLQDKYFLTYPAAAGAHVTVYFRMEKEADFHEEEMKEMYGGLFVKMFLLFPGETVQYYIMEEGPGGVYLTESGCAVMGEGAAEMSAGAEPWDCEVAGKEGSSGSAPERRTGSSGNIPDRYVRISRMLRRRLVGDTEALVRQLKEYDEIQKKAETVFKLL